MNQADPSAAIAIEPSIRREIDDFAAWLPTIHEGALDEFLPEYHHRLAELDSLTAEDPIARSAAIRYCVSATESELQSGLLHPRARHKPLGYAGDYLLLDWMHRGVISDDLRGRRWDEFFHLQVAPSAVRGRKALLVDSLVTLNREEPDGAVLNLACGGCADVADARAAGATLLTIHCVDREPLAVAHARRVLQDARNVDVEEGNALTLRMRNTFTFVWCAGLFDYLNDRLAIALLSRMWKWTAVGGRMMFGNFHVGNPTRLAQDWILDWQLIYRSEEDCLKLLHQAGVPQQLTRTFTDSTGAIVYAEARKRP